MSVPVPVIVFCGFLGSGKTSAVCQLLQQCPERRTAVLLNEFGELSVDAGRLPRRESLVLTEISGGSIFCMCKKGALLTALRRLAEEVGPDLLLIEASGLAEPADISSLLQVPVLAAAFAPPRTVTLVDALNYSKLASIVPALAEQVRVADLLLVNKSDRVGPEALAALLAALRELNPTAVLRPTCFGRFQLDEIPALPAAAGERPFWRCGPPDGMVRFDWQSRRPVRVARLPAWLRAYGAAMLRGKGVILGESGEVLRLDVVNGEVALQPEELVAGRELAASELFFVFRGQIPAGFAAALEELTQ